MSRYTDLVAASSPDDEPVETPADRIRAALLSTEQLRSIPKPKPLIDGLLYLDSLGMIYGPSGVGKTFVTLDLAMSVAGLDRWHGRRVERAGVLYVIAEGAPGISMRTDAWRERHQVDAPVMWLPWAINVYEPTWAGALAEVVAERRPGLVVLDTFARSIVGADENSARDIGVAIEHLEHVRRAAGSCVALVHHTGKNLDAGARGTSALKAAMTTEIEISGDPTRFTVKVTKQKDAAAIDPLHFRLTGAADSVVVTPVGAESPDELPAGVLETLDALRHIEVPGGVSTRVWRVAVGLPERTFYRHRAELVKHGFVENVGTDKTPKYQVKQHIEGDE